MCDFNYVLCFRHRTSEEATRALNYFNKSYINISKYIKQDTQYKEEFTHSTPIRHDLLQGCSGVCLAKRPRGAPAPLEQVTILTILAKPKPVLL